LAAFFFAIVESPPSVSRRHRHRPGCAAYFRLLFFFALFFAAFRFLAIEFTSSLLRQ
jgi:hypothetical protein